MLKIQNNTEQNMKIVHMESKEKPSCCPCCGSEKFNKKAPENRTILDIYEGVPTKIIITKQRFYCPHCRHSFSSDDSYPVGQKYTKDFEDFVAQTMVNENLSVTQMSQKYGISRAYVSGALSIIKNDFKTVTFKLRLVRRYISIRSCIKTNTVAAFVARTKMRPKT